MINVRKINTQCLFSHRLLHTKRLRREIARLEKMEREIAVKTTQIGEMIITPEPKSRNCWTPSSSSDKKSRNAEKSKFLERIVNDEIKIENQKVRLFRYSRGILRLNYYDCNL